MKPIAVWDIDKIRESYEEVPDMIPAMEQRFGALFRFMNDNHLLAKAIVDSSGNLTTRRLVPKDFAALGSAFAGAYETKW